MNLSDRNPLFQGEVKRSPWGRHLSMSLRNPAKPALSTLAHCAAVNRIERCSSISLAGFGGLPIGFFSVFISQLSVIQKVLQFMTYCNSISHMQLTYKFRLRDTCDSELKRQARAVSYVWNYCNETQQQAVKRKRKWLTWHDLQKLTAGSSKELDIHAHTIQQVCQVYDRSRAAKKLVRQLHAKVKAQRDDHLHKVSTRLVQTHGAIFVGNVNAAGLAKTTMAKSVLDAGWSAFRQKLAYKAIRHQVLFKEVNEAYSTQTCSQCASIEGPKGLKGLGIRQWTCVCGSVHDRDINAAKNIARRGLASLGVGASA